jgi:hypothetical protein
MKNLLSAAGAIKKAQGMTAKEFESQFDNQITILDADNICNVNEENFNIIFSGKDGLEASLLFFNGKLENAYIM